VTFIITVCWKRISYLISDTFPAFIVWSEGCVGQATYRTCHNKLSSIYTLLAPSAGSKCKEYLTTNQKSKTWLTF